MNPEALNAELTRTPFVPLRLRLSDGQVVEISNPDEAVISNLAVYVFKLRRDARHISNDTQLISLRHIVTVEQMVDAGTSP